MNNCTRINTARLLGILAAVFIVASTAFAQTPACPSAPGVYALSNSHWIELSRVTAAKMKIKTTWTFAANVIVAYPGSSSSVTLPDSAVICVSGVQRNTIFSLARAKVKRNTREVEIEKARAFLNASVDFGVDKKESIAITQKRITNEGFVIRTDGLKPGQYILFVQSGVPLSYVTPAFDFAVQ